MAMVLNVTKSLCDLWWVMAFTHTNTFTWVLLLESKFWLWKFHVGLGFGIPVYGLLPRRVAWAETSAAIRGKFGGVKWLATVPCQSYMMLIKMLQKHQI